MQGSSLKMVLLNQLAQMVRCSTTALWKLWILKNYVDSCSNSKWNWNEMCSWLLYYRYNDSRSSTKHGDRWKQDIVPFQAEENQKIHAKYIVTITPLITFGVSYREIRKGRKETVPGWKMAGKGLTEFLKLTSSEETSYLRDKNILILKNV